MILLLSLRMVRLARQFAGADLVGEILCHMLPRAAVEAVNLLLFERAFALLLGKESLEIFHQALDGLSGKLLSAHDNGLVVRHVEPLSRERFGWLCNLAHR